MNDEKGYFLNIFGQYARRIRIWNEVEICLKCGKTESCLSCDSSEEEYSVIYICKNCIKDLFEC